MSQNFPGQASEFDRDDHVEFSRSMAELQWLLLVLVVLYFFIPIREVTNTDALIVTMVSYSISILVFRYLNSQLRETRLRLAVETWIMTAFITITLWYTGFTESPLLNLYLLVIIACAITLGKAMTLLEVILIACCYMLLGYKVHSVEIFTPETFTTLMANFSPFLLVAYVTSILASDILAAKRRIAQLSHTDELTGVLNMRAFNLLFKKEVDSARRHGSPVTIIMVDMDGLKAANDKYGHSVGTCMIKAVSVGLRSCLRTSDVLARYGGDEFIIMLDKPAGRAGYLVAERMRKVVSDIAFNIGGETVITTVSIGLANFPNDISDVEDVLDKADEALYISKQKGRNRVTCYSDDSAEPDQAVSDTN